MQDWMIDNVVVPVVTIYGLAKEYEYLKYSINGYLTGSFSVDSIYAFSLYGTVDICVLNPKILTLCSSDNKTVEVIEKSQDLEQEINLWKVIQQKK
ncbi:unnamed protein product, partial [Arabidopsis halleri]